MSGPAHRLLRGQAGGWMAEHMLMRGRTMHVIPYLMGPQMGCSNLNDVARVEDRTFICSTHGRTPYLVPYFMGTQGFAPEHGVFVGASARQNQLRHDDTAFTNAALTPDVDVWWERKDSPKGWLGEHMLFSASIHHKYLELRRERASRQEVSLADTIYVVVNMLFMTCMDWRGQWGITHGWAIFSIQ